MTTRTALAPEAELNRYSGARLDARYRLLNLLGRDRLGDVWGALDERLDRRVAVHVFNRDYLSDGRFQAHASTLARLGHPGLVRLYDANADAEFDDGTGAPHRCAIMVTELADGPTLGQRLETAPLGLPAVASMARDLASALTYLHEAGLTGTVITANTIMIWSASWFGDDAGRLESDGTPVAKFSIDCVAPSGPPTAGSGSPAADIHAFGRVLSEILGPAGQHRGWNELVRDMVDADPGRRPTARQLCTRLAQLEVDPDEIIPWETAEPEPDSRAVGPRHRAKVRSGRVR